MTPPRATRRASLAGAVTLAGWALLVLAAASVVGGRAFPLELFVHFWPQLGVVLLCTAAIAGRGGARSAAAVQAVGGIALLGAVAWNLWAAGRPRAEGPAELTALFANVGSWNTSRRPLLELVREVGADIIGLAEADATWIASLEPVRRDYPHAILAPRDDDFGIALLSRHPLADGSIERLDPNRLPTIFATVLSPSGPWRVGVAHPVPPFHGAAFRARNRHLAAIADVVRADTLPTVLLADLNATLWSPYVRDLRRTADLASATADPRALYTWPAGWPLLALGLDHCLYDGSVREVGSRVLGDIGSDHLPVTCRFTRR